MTSTPKVTLFPSRSTKKNLRILLVGAVCQDQTPGGLVLGGAVSFVGKLLKSWFCEVEILTSCHEALLKSPVFEGIQVHNQVGPTVTFKHEYDALSQKRRSYCFESGNPIKIDLNARAQSRFDAIVFCPVGPEIRPEARFLTEYQGTVGVLAQGLYRYIDPEDGRLGNTCFRWDSSWLRPDLMCMNVSDITNFSELVYGRDWPAEETVFTDDLNPVHLWKKDLCERISVEPVVKFPVDTTGAGDIFAAAVLYGKLHKLPLRASVRVAMLAVARAIEEERFVGIPSWDAIKNRISPLS